MAVRYLPQLGIVIGSGVLAAVVSVAPFASADVKAWHADEFPMVALPLPNDPELQPPGLPAATIAQMTEQFCANELSAQQLADIDRVYKTALPVVFGKASDPKDPVAMARKQVFGNDQFTNESRAALCNDAAKRTEYAAALDREIAAVGVELHPDLLQFDPERRKSEILVIWDNRTAAFSDALGMRMAS